MGYALNLCKFHIYNVPYNHNIAEEGMEMTQNRVRIVDVADALGLSTATISNVIHGKTEKISDDAITIPEIAKEIETKILAAMGVNDSIISSGMSDDEEDSSEIDE